MTPFTSSSSTGDALLPPARITYPEHLPVSSQRQQIMNAVAGHQVVIVAGETGSGKTTQLPKMCLELGLDQHGMIGHTQPRRIAARSVAERIAEELNETVGEHVGYQVRFTSEVSAETSVKVMTDGILLAEIQHDPLLRRYSMLIIDEAHERSLNIDFLLGYLKKILPQRQDLKVIITSATIDVESFAEHFSTPTGAAAPIIEVSGRTYPVEIRYRPLTDPRIADDPDDDADDAEDARDPLGAVADAVLELGTDHGGDTLVFFPGEREIRDAKEVIQAAISSHPRLKHADILPLYGRLSLAEQQRVFRRSSTSAPRIVLATNVAETSLTVPGITAVIDTGTARISRYSQRTKVQRLPVERISQASANQRAGRAGRTSPGVAIRLYSEEDFNQRPEFTDPEILRTSLASVILDMLAAGVATTPTDLEEFPFLQPPEHRQITDGIQQLLELGALNSGAPVEVTDRSGTKRTRTFTRGTITPLGRRLAQLPIDPRLGRMILAADEHKVAREVMVLAAGMTIQDPRERPADQRDAADQAHARFTDENSDFSAMLNLWVYLRSQQKQLSGNQFRKMCRREFINYLRVREWQNLVQQLREMAHRVGLKVSAGPVDPVGTHEAVHQAVLTGLLSQIGTYQQRTKEYLGARNTKFRIFPGSGLFTKRHDYVMAAELVETSRLWARQVAKVEPEWIEEIAGPLAKSSVSDPYWSTRQGSAMARERVTVYGVPVAVDRPIKYYRVNRELAREMFIRHALVDGDWHTRHRFFARNRERMAEVDQLQTRHRRHDLKVSDEDLFAFYDARIPASVVSARHFDRWWKKARRTDEYQLDIAVEDLIRVEPEQLDPAQYPSVLIHPTEHGELELPLDYTFAPTTLAQTRRENNSAGTPPPTDGVTVTIAVEILHRMNPDRFAWLIPGLREELITALIKNVPKALRKQLVPAPDTARRALAILHRDYDPLTDDFYDALSAVLLDVKHVKVPRDQWRPEALPEHLRMTFSVVDHRGAVIGVGEDLGQLQRDLAGENRTALAESLTRAAQAQGVDLAQTTQHPTPGPGKDTTRRQPASNSGKQPPRRDQDRTVTESFTPRQGLTRWDIPELPEQVQTPVATGSGHQLVTGYPALSPATTGVGADLVIMRTLGEAQSVHRHGVVALLRAGLPDTQRYIADHLSNEEKLTFTSAPHSDLQEIVSDSLTASIDALVPASHSQLPRSAQQFEQLHEQVRAEVIDQNFRVTAVVSEALHAARHVRRDAKTLKSLTMAPVLTDIRAQLDELLGEHFVAKTGWRQLRHLPRYIRAITVRIEKLQNSAHGLQADAASMQVIHDLEQAYQRRVDDYAQAGFIPVELSQVFWLLQELRVSFFAQQLGTAVSVSEKKVRAALRAVPSP
ncbi:ATP-dependent RNA helicase HrpA [Auritidibacter ignavus]|uniref:RNA helicase n=1 Tax=Auritidibacter ignavus TaxID=678932 RepID=A0AAJ6DF32_9MICC|nr:ATP-dependent RNA helicase HrpA [Auritidibacter ignavus]WGH93358.1 ATP-dependent RNA helicase HrpA [Auritidibacter ignavus]